MFQTSVNRNVCAFHWFTYYILYIAIIFSWFLLPGVLMSTQMFHFSAKIDDEPLLLCMWCSAVVQKCAIVAQIEPCKIWRITHCFQRKKRKQNVETSHVRCITRKIVVALGSVLHVWFLRTRKSRREWSFAGCLLILKCISLTFFWNVWQLKL